MTKDNLETRVFKAVLRMEKKLKDIYNSLNDMNLKLYHIIQDNKSADEIYYDMIHEGVAFFVSLKNIDWKKQVVVAADPNTIDTDGDGYSDIAEEANDTLYWHPDDNYNGAICLNRPTADFNKDCVVDHLDLIILAENWLNTGVITE